MDELRSLLAGMKADQASLIDHIHSIMWGMRGSLSREEAWCLSVDERKSIMKQIEERTKMVEKTGLAIL